MFGSRPSRTPTSNQSTSQTPRSTPTSTPQTPRTPVTPKSTPTSPPPVSPPPPKSTLNPQTHDVDDSDSDGARPKPESNPLQPGTRDLGDFPPRNTPDRKPRNPQGLRVNTAETSLRPSVSFEEKLSKTRRPPSFQTANYKDPTADTVKYKEKAEQGPVSTGGLPEDHEANNGHVRQSSVTGTITSQSKARFGFTKPLDFWEWDFIGKLECKCP